MRLAKAVCGQRQGNPVERMFFPIPTGEIPGGFITVPVRLKSQLPPEVTAATIAAIYEVTYTELDRLRTRLITIWKTQRTAISPFQFPAAIIFYLNRLPMQQGMAPTHFGFISDRAVKPEADRLRLPKRYVDKFSFE